MNTTRISIVLILALALVTGAMAVEELPQFPDEYKGTVTIDGKPAPAGTTILALIDGEVRGTLTIEEKGTFGGDMNIDKNLIVTGYADDAGKTITFTANGKNAGKATFRPEEIHTVALAAKSGGTTPGGGGGGGGSSPSNPAPVKTVAPSVEAPAAPPVGSTNLTTSSGGMVDKATAVVSSDRIATITVPEGTGAHASDGTPLDEISIRPALSYEVPTVTGETGFAFSGYAYLCGPAGATFNPPITLTFEIPAEEWKKLKGDQFTIKWYNTDAGRWEEIPTTVDYETMTVTAKVSHFSTFALFTAAPATGDDNLPAAQVTDQTRDGATGGKTNDWTIPIVAGVLVIIVIAGAGLYLMKR
ncbi:hypothetical protein RJ40_12040 [Methanofollis aquaemaris]|uniref:PGF-pre-PGF domain-containing protein n=1 Tax=Methanofollis aquaemaris TaxID=126734 RepID=A0A8A3S960_9EURY|nr:hypothetical protein [Methanofollis aquaemaris]QSZ68171.1 hypothetical protein RJ40_12040 [Methanofollis aquaemaris]